MNAEKITELSKLTLFVLQEIENIADTKKEIIEMQMSLVHAICHFLVKGKSNKEKGQFFVDLAYAEKKATEFAEEFGLDI